MANEHAPSRDRFPAPATWLAGVSAAVLGAVWSVNRVIYAIGYTNGSEGGKGRYYGALWMLAHYILMGYAGTAAWKIAMA